jgi:hypothetical protein
MAQSTESINSTWRSVDDISAAYSSSDSTSAPLGHDQVLADELQRNEYKDKMSPSSYSVGRTRSTSGGNVRDLSLMDFSPSGKSHSSSGSSGSGSLHGENINMSHPNSPVRERSYSNMSGGGGGSRVGRISEGSVSLHMDDDNEGEGEGGGEGEYMFGMDDVDSLENSLEDFNGFGQGRGGEQGGQSPLSSYLTKSSSLRVEFGACTKLGPKTNQEDRFVMIPSLTVPLKSNEEIEGYDDDSNTYRCEHSYAAVYDGE